MQTFVDVVEHQATRRAERIAYTFLPDGEREDRSVTFGELAARARALGDVLVARGASGQPVLVLCPAGIDYVVSLLACFYAGSIAVPAYPPARVSLARTMPRLAAIYDDCKPRAALATSSVREFLRSSGALGSALAGLSLIAADEPASPPGDAAPPRPRIEPSTPAILQYTSGSTGAPKGVLLTHAQLLANVEMIRASGELTEADVIFSWLPPYHDMGLIGAILVPPYLGARAVLTPPETFVRKPERWLAAAQRYRATLLTAPGFAFDVCTRRVPAEARRDLDLSSWRLVYIGAEPIHAATLDAFAEAFGPCGFRREAFYPCYGMAEATLIISGGTPGAAPTVRAYEADALERHQAVRADTSTRSPPARGDETVRLRRLVGCGRALLDTRIAIVDPQERRTLPERAVGEIWVKSRSVASGYHQQPDATAGTFQAYTSDTGEGPFLRTGDLGFFDEGELFVTGRLKDLIIVRGQNHYPQDIERTVQAVNAALVSDAGAAFAVDSVAGEQLVIVQEVDKRSGVQPEELLSPIVQAVRERHELAASAVVLIKRGTLLKTSSGKVQRRAIQAAFHAGTLQVVAAWRAPGLAAHPPAPSADAFATASAPPAMAPDAREPAAASRREQRIADWLRDRLASRLGVSARIIDPHEPLARYGVDSLIAAELTEQLERWLGVELPSTISYDNPTIADLARVLAGVEPGAGSRKVSAQAARARPAAAADRGDEPIAIVGMACRLPGAAHLAAFWSLLLRGGDAIGEVPRARFDVDALYDPEPGSPGKLCSRFGGFIDGIDRFDAAFFGIAPREAARMDPQQRLFLETAWHALEDAGQSPEALAGSDAGVFAGVCSNDYAMLYGGDLSLIDGDYGTGAAPGIVANRVSYALDLRGPSETIDTACSSALVALHHACRSLQGGECQLAIAGGVNAVLAPETSVYFSQLRALAGDGRCKAFDARADGLVRSEGAGVVVLKRLSRALADGDRIYALIAGAAVNHDGRSNGLLAPSGPAQRQVVLRALAAAGIGPAELDYVEAHGVGTRVADAVELHALGGVMSEQPRERPLLVGSAKTNVGHLEAASGIVGLIKVALALSHERIPPHLHLQRVHPDIAAASLPIAIPTEALPWPRGERPRFAGVSAFGFGGTNAHVVVREAPLRDFTGQGDVPRHVLALSAKTRSALRARARDLATSLESERDLALADLCFTANAGRAHFAHRLAFVCRDVHDVRAQLADWLAGSAGSRALCAEVEPGRRVQVGFAFTHAQVAPGAARGLYEADARFRQVLERCDELLGPQLGARLSELLYGPAAERGGELLRRPAHAHAALVALQYALFELWRSAGIAPAAVYGQGAGEYAAAAAAGVIGWEQAVVLAARRGLVHEGILGGGQPALGVREFRNDLAALEYRAPHVPLVSAARGGAFAAGEMPDAAHFRSHLYHEPGAGDWNAALLAQDCDAHLELPAHDLTGEDDLARWLASLARLYVQGVRIDWQRLYAPLRRQKVGLPAYPFERQRHWLDFPDRGGERAFAVLEHPSSHPLLSHVRIRVSSHGGSAARSLDADPQGEPSSSG